MTTFPSGPSVTVVVIFAHADAGATSAVRVTTAANMRDLLASVITCLDGGRHGILPPQSDAQTILAEPTQRGSRSRTTTVRRAELPAASELTSSTRTAKLPPPHESADVTRKDDRGGRTLPGPQSQHPRTQSNDSRSLPGAANGLRGRKRQTRRAPTRLSLRTRDTHTRREPTTAARHLEATKGQQQRHSIQRGRRVPGRRVSGRGSVRDGWERVERLDTLPTGVDRQSVRDCAVETLAADHRVGVAVASEQQVVAIVALVDKAGPCRRPRSGDHARVHRRTDPSPRPR